MSTVNTVENLRLWFLTCPTISSLMSFNVDYIGAKATDCTIYTTPSNLNYVEDVLGNIEYTKRQTIYFYLAVRFPYSDDVERNLDNLDFFSTVQDWMYTQNSTKNFPTIAEGDVVSIMPQKTAYVTDVNADSAVYEIQCALTYDRDD